MLVAAGGTVGHLAPALAVADTLRRDGAHVEFAVSTRPADAEVVRARGYVAHPFAIGGLPRRPGIAQLRAIWQAVMAVPRSMRIVRRTRPDAMLAGGGFVSAPVALAAWLLRVPVVVTEADAHLGLANRMSARVAKVLCAAYPLERFRDRQVVTGRPVADAFVDAPCDPARAKLGLPPDEPVLVAIGGSGGALHLSRAVFEAYGEDADPRAGGRPLHVLHVTGRRDHSEFAGRARSERYRVIEYCDDMPTLLAAADLVVSRPGGSVFEIAAVGRAAILVPSPFVTADHQTLNARHFEVGGAALLVTHADFSGARLRELAGELLAESGDARRREMSEAMRGLARPDAAADIAAHVEQVARPGRGSGRKQAGT